MAVHPFLDHDGPIAFAHRGGAEEYPENSMHAFESAVRLGYRYLETDVHATSDGVLVAFHDAELDRVTDGRGRIADLPWSKVQQARIAGTEPIPLFTDLVAAFPEARINIDVKLDNAVGPFVDAVRRTGIIDRICVGGFSDARTARVRGMLGDRLCTSLGPKATAALRAGSYGLPFLGGLARRAGQCAQVPVRQGPLPLVDRSFLKKAHRLGMQVHVWTIDDPAEMERLLDIGVDGIMTDRPSVLKHVLERRGQWS